MIDSSFCESTAAAERNLVLLVMSWYQRSGYSIGNHSRHSFLMGSMSEGESVRRRIFDPGTSFSQPSCGSTSSMLTSMPASTATYVMVHPRLESRRTKVTESEVRRRAKNMKSTLSVQLLLCWCYHESSTLSWHFIIAWLLSLHFFEIDEVASRFLDIIFSWPVSNINHWYIKTGKSDIFFPFHQITCYAFGKINRAYT